MHLSNNRRAKRGSNPTAMNWFYWTGVIAWIFIAMRVIHFILETLVVMTLGWDKLEEVGLPRALWILLTLQPLWRDSPKKGE